jgi:hypothetical protein
VAAPVLVVAAVGEEGLPGGHSPSRCGPVEDPLGVLRESAEDGLVQDQIHIAFLGVDVLVALAVDPDGELDLVGVVGVAGHARVRLILKNKRAKQRCEDND